MQSSISSFFQKTTPEKSPQKGASPEKLASPTRTITDGKRTPEKLASAKPLSTPEKTPSPHEFKKRKLEADEDAAPASPKRMKEDASESKVEGKPTINKAFSFSGDDLIDDEALMNMAIPASSTTTSTTTTSTSTSTSTPNSSTPNPNSTSTTKTATLASPSKPPPKAAGIFQLGGGDTSNPSAVALFNLITEGTWKTILKPELKKPYFPALVKFLDQEKAIKNNKILPPEHLIFNALNQCTFEKVRVVILGQDPYISPAQAMGMSFSVPRGVAVPASLKNIYKELSEDISGFKIPDHGDLTKWAQQGVLLLNAVLTVRVKESNSHKGKGWEHFTEAVIKAIDTKKEGVVFLLWGKDAQAKAKDINTKKHLVLKAAHPSPLAGGAFNGNKHFSKTNKYLVDHSETPIDWTL